MLKFSIAAIASPLESKYLDEWVAYHKAIGVEHFFLATNDWDFTTLDPSVSTVRIDGRAMQVPYYNWCVRNLSSQTLWCAFIDIDEFINCKSMEELVNGHEQDDAICLSWKLFGSSNLHFNGDYSVLRRFTRRQRGFNKHVKSMLNLHNTINKFPLFVNPHFAINISTKSVDGRDVLGPFDLDADKHISDEQPWIAHFFTKTPEEWSKKRKRGRIDIPQGSPLMFRDDSEFKEHDLNEIEDVSLRDRLK